MSFFFAPLSDSSKIFKFDVLDVMNFHVLFIPFNKFLNQYSTNYGIYFKLLGKIAMQKAGSFVNLL